MANFDFKSLEINFAYLPVETVIHNNQKEYYRLLAKCDREGNSTDFVEFMLNTIALSLKDLIVTDHVADHVTDQVTKLLLTLLNRTLSALEIMHKLNLSHRPTFRKNYLHPALNSGLIEMTIPDKPKSSLQKYRVTIKGKRWIKKNKI